MILRQIVFTFFFRSYFTVLFCFAPCLHARSVTLVANRYTNVVKATMWNFIWIYFFLSLNVQLNKPIDRKRWTRIEQYFRNCPIVWFIFVDKYIGVVWISKVPTPHRSSWNPWQIRFAKFSFSSKWRLLFFRTIHMISTVLSVIPKAMLSNVTHVHVYTI